MARKVKAPDAVGAATGAGGIVGSGNSVDGTPLPPPPQAHPELGRRDFIALAADDDGRWWCWRFRRGIPTGQPARVGDTRPEAIRRARERHGGMPMVVA